MSNITVKAGTPIESNDIRETKYCEALVLSAGGLFAAHQAGVYKALWPYWKPDLAVGASAGALNAWLIASRIEPDELIEQWLHPDAGKAVKFRQRPSLSRGYFDPEPLLARARDIQRDFQRSLPMGIVAIEVPRFRPRIFRDEEITPEHLVASCSIPLFYPMVRINGRRLLDGGLFEATPVWAAAAMGATRIIAINSLPKLTPWPIHMVLSAMHSRRKMAVPQTVDVSMIVPSGKMGSARDAVVWRKENILRWVEMGLKDGEEFLRSRGECLSTRPC